MNEFASVQEELLALLRPDKRRPLSIIESEAASPEQSNTPLYNPDKGQNGKAEGSPVDELARSLFCKDGEQTPGNGNSAWEVTFRTREGVEGSGTFEEEETEEDKDLGPDSGTVLECINAEGGEGRKDDKEDGPPVPEGEGKVDEELVCDGGWRVILLDNVVDIGNGRSDEESEDKGNVGLTSGQVDIGGVEDN